MEDADFSELCGSASPHPVRCHVIINEHEITNDKAIADQLNKFFSNIGKNLALTVPKPNLPFNCYLDKPQASVFFLLLQQRLKI